MQHVEKVNVIGSEISVATRDVALASIQDCLDNAAGSYACFVNAHVTVEARHDESLREAVNKATFAFPDGMPVFLTARLKSAKRVEKISGPDFLQWVFADPQLRKRNHYFFGSTPETLEALVKRLEKVFPGCNIVGWESPPFRPVSDAELADSIDKMVQARAELIWIGLGAPKQEVWMAKNFARLPNTLLLGVGAAFDFHAGVVRRAPVWMQKFGLEWLYRLLQEPRRLWKRYLVTNTLFVYHLLAGVIFGARSHGQ
ncbi:MAG TPA: WecB/TagA/CpsF family glycosyltransferase [Pseudomonadales bacterium]|nr:WecB/TagA/CpsF family glycosyltransferase [Pseudomonadales bacterium]